MDLLPNANRLTKFVDTRPEATERSNFTQYIPINVMERIVRSALARGFDPYIALGMGMRETNMGTRGERSNESVYDNPLRFNYPVHFRETPNDRGGTDLVPKDPREFKEWYTGSGEIDAVNLALDLAKYKMRKYGLQGYQGTGKYEYNNPRKPAVLGYENKVKAMADIFRAMPVAQAIVQRGGVPIKREYQLPDIEILGSGL